MNLTVQPIPAEDLERCVEFGAVVWPTVPEPSLRLMLQKSFDGGHVLGAFDDTSRPMIGLRAAGPKPHGYLQTYLLGVAEPYRNQDIAKTLSLTGRLAAIDHGYETILALINLTDAALMGLCIEGLGMTARGLARLDSLLCESTWELKGARAQAAVEGKEIPREVRWTVEVPDTASGTVLAPLLMAHFAKGRSIVGFSHAEGRNTYQIGVQ